MRIIKGAERRDPRGLVLPGGRYRAGRPAKHRTSRDLDWFTDQAFDAEILRRTLEEAPEKPTAHRTGGSAHAARVLWRSSRRVSSCTSRFGARPKRLPSASRSRCPLASLELLAGMKAAAVHGRGSNATSSTSTPSAWNQAGPFRVSSSTPPALCPFRRSRSRAPSSYFDDAEPQPMPASSKYSWPEVKKALVAGVQLWERTRNREPDVER